MLPDAPVAILVCGDAGAGSWPQFWEQDCAAATENLLIAAEQLGLGSVWLGLHPLSERVEGVRRLLAIPGSIVPFALLAVGWPAEHKEPAQRYDAARVHQERW
jgi:nitroreductase